MNSSQMPSLHAEVMKYIHFNLITRHWNGETIPNGRTRKIPFSCLLEADIPIEELVDAIQIDLIDAQMQLQVKTCQALRHEERMCLMYVYNRYNKKQIERDLQDQLTKLQEDSDKESLLGALEAAGKKFPKIVVRVDYPYNGPFERNRDGVDSSYKRVFIIEYALEDKEHVETAVAAYKKSGRLTQFFGEHANIQIAPSKDAEETATTTIQKWHSICDSHSATMLSTGMVRLDGIKNPDVVIPVEYWKASSRPRPDEMTLRQVLHSVKVSGANQQVQVFHGLCRAADGGYEAAVADTIPLAKAQARNVAAHPAAWVQGYTTSKGWKKACVEQLLKKSFNISSVVSAQSSKWDRRTGQVTSEDLDETEQELRNVTESWVDMSLLSAGRNVVQENAVLEGGDMAAFDWEGGASVRTMNTRGSEPVSDAETSLVNSSDDEETDYGEYSGEDDDERMSEEGSNSKSDEENADDDDEAGYWTAASLAEWPIRELFKDDVELRDNIVKTLKEGELDIWCIRQANRYNDLAEEAGEIDEKLIELIAEETGGKENPEFEEQREMLDFRLNEIECEKDEIKLRLQEALKDFPLRDEDVDSSAQQKHSVGFSTDIEGQEQEGLNEFQDAQEAEAHPSQAADMNVDEDPKQNDAQSQAGREPG
jgi:hypothetical protein